MGHRLTLMETTDCPHNLMDFVRLSEILMVFGLILQIFSINDQLHLSILDIKRIAHPVDSILVSPAMKILQPNAGALTNFEVLDFLRSKGPGKDPTRLIASIAPSEYKVYAYLEQTAACNQTREIINDFLGKCKNYDLAKAEILNIVNIRPSSIVEIDPIIEECDTRFGEIVEEMVETLSHLLLPPPIQMESDEGIGDGKVEVPGQQQKEVPE